MGIALAELIAYVGDQLSYQQDAVATEAYLRRRAAASRCAAMRCWSTTTCTTAATRAPGSRGRSVCPSSSTAP